VSKLVEISNAVYDRCDVNWLTPSQKRVYDLLAQGFTAQPLINVYGRHGVGKTVLAWVLARDGFGTYCPTPSDLPAHTSRALVDGFTGGRREARRLIDQMRQSEVHQAVLFTTSPIDDDLPIFEVRLLPEDIARCRANLYQQFDIRFLSERAVANLHDLLSSGVRGAD
jgi:hypothetical protein